MVVCLETVKNVISLRLLRMCVEENTQHMAFKLRHEIYTTFSVSFSFRVFFWETEIWFSSFFILNVKVIYRLPKFDFFITSFLYWIFGVYPIFSLLFYTPLKITQWFLRIFGFWCLFCWMVGLAIRIGFQDVV